MRTHSLAYYTLRNIDTRKSYQSYPQRIPFGEEASDCDVENDKTFKKSGFSAKAILSYFFPKKKSEISDREFIKIKESLESPSYEFYDLKRKYMRKDNIELFKFLSKHDNLDILYSRVPGKSGYDKFSLIERIFYDKELPNKYIQSIVEHIKIDNIEESIDNIKLTLKNHKQVYKNISEYNTNNPTQEKLKTIILDYLDYPAFEEDYSDNDEKFAKYLLDNMQYLGEEGYERIPAELLASSIKPEDFKAKIEILNFLKENKRLERYSKHLKNEDNITNIMTETNANTLKIAKILVAQDDISTKETIKLLSSINPGTEDFICELFENKFFRKICKNDTPQRINSAIQGITTNNIEMIKAVYNQAKSEKTILKTINSFVQKSPNTLKLCNTYNIPLIDMTYVDLDNYNAKFISRMYYDKRFNTQNIIDVAKVCHDNNYTQLVKAMYETKRYNPLQICDLVNDMYRYTKEGGLTNSVLTGEKIKTIKEILNNKKFPEDLIIDILKNTGYNYDILKFTGKLISENKIPAGDVQSIVSLITAQNLNVVQKLYNANINVQDIIDIQKTICDIEFEKIEGALSEYNDFNLDDYREYADSDDENSRHKLKEFLIDYAKFKISKKDVDYDHIISLIKLGVYKKHPELKSYHPAMWDWILLSGNNPKNINDECLLYNYVATGNPKIYNQYSQLIKDAFANRNILRVGDGEITDNDIMSVFLKPETIETLNVIGKGNLEAAFSPSIYSFEDFCSYSYSLFQLLSKENLENLKKKLNPESSEEYIEMQKDVYMLKNKINSLISEEDKLKKYEIDKEISELKEKLKTSDLKAQKEIQSRIKTLKYDAQKIYYNSANSSRIMHLMKQVSSKNRAMKKFVEDNKIKMEPQDVITKIRVLIALWDEECAAPEIENKKLASFIDLIQDDTSENEEKWKEAVNKEIYKQLDIDTPYSKDLTDKLDLINCKYLSQVLSSDEDFFDNFSNLVNIIAKYQDENIETIIDTRIPQNVETKRIYAEKGIDYEKWTKFNPESYISVPLLLSAEEAKVAAIKNIEEDLNDKLFNSISVSAKKRILKALASVGISLKKVQIPEYDQDGFNVGNKKYLKLYNGESPIAFDDMPKIVKAVKDEINSSEYWTTADEDNSVNCAKETLYDHLVRRRPAEVEIAKNIKGTQSAYIKVQKTNMYDIKKAIGLGNDAQCCTALGSNFNEWTAPNYIKNKCIGAIEVLDGDKFIGNTMMYIAEVNGELALVLDNIELKTDYQNNSKIRDAIISYAAKICEEIGRPDMGIYAGPNRHKVDMSIYPVVAEAEMKILGDSGNDDVYLDFDADGHVICYPYNGEEVSLFKIRKATSAPN